jgi:hypothetical protein
VSASAWMELERVVRLRVDVHADDVEPGAVVADGAAAGAAEQIQEARPHCLPSRRGRAASSRAPRRRRFLAGDSWPFQFRDIRLGAGGASEMRSRISSNRRSCSSSAARSAARCASSTLRAFTLTALPLNLSMDAGRAMELPGRVGQELGVRWRFLRSAGKPLHANG